MVSRDQRGVFPVDYRNSTIAVLDVAAGEAAIWQVSTTRLDQSESALSGAWVFQRDDREQWERLTFARRCWSTPDAGAFLAGRGWQFGIPLDAEAVRCEVQHHRQALIEAFRVRCEGRPGLREPDWPTISGPLDVSTGGPAGPGRALRAARWFAGLVEAWQELEQIRTAKTRPYLHPLGGVDQLPLPLSAADRPQLDVGVPLVAATKDAPTLDFVAIDFETANSRRSSPCALGLVRFRDGEPTDEWARLMRPPEGSDHFDAYNVRIHGITASEVSAEPRFGYYWPQIRNFIGDDPLVAHNAAFDLGVLRASLVAEGLEVPEMTYVCTMRAARRSLDLLSYSLPSVADALRVPIHMHHRPLEDARAAGQVLLALALRNDGVGGPPLFTPLKAPRPAGRAQPRPELPTPADADPGHPLHGSQVAFTGSLDSMSRQEAWQMLAMVGGNPQQGVNRQTNILVVGPRRYQGEVLTGEAMTGKMRKAAQLRAAGQRIEIMSEDEFLRCL